MNKTQDIKPTKELKLTASQRIAALEGLAAHQAEQIGVLAEENDRNRSLIGSLAKRINAAIEAAEQGPLTGNAVNKLILDENVKELESKVNFLVEQGALKLDNTSLITEKSFIVGRDLDKEGNVVNPRVQFAVGSISQELQTLFIGHSSGDSIPSPEDTTSFEVSDVYTIVDPETNKRFDEELSENDVDSTSDLETETDAE